MTLTGQAHTAMIEAVARGLTAAGVTYTLPGYRTDNSGKTGVAPSGSLAHSSFARVGGDGTGNADPAVAGEGDGAQLLAAAVLLPAQPASIDAT